MRVSPSPAGGLYPRLIQLNPGHDPFTSIAYASFATRRQVAGGGFYDFTARYGGVREEDKITLRESLEESLEVEGPHETKEYLVKLTKRLDIERFLDLPVIALSNGQTRRAHIVRSLLRRPEVLLLDEPLTGLDVQQRPNLLGILQELHTNRHPRIVMGLRKHDAIPEWVTHVALASGDVVRTGPKEDVLSTVGESSVFMGSQPEAEEQPATNKKPAGKVVLETKNLTVAYHERKVLKGIDWTIREGERWHLRGANGSGKTTLLSMLTGDHPQSYLQPHLELFGKPRRKQSTIQIQQQIGFVSPELFNAFPRRVGPQGLTVRDAIGSGLHAIFTYRARTEDEDGRIDELVRALGPEGRWGGEGKKNSEWEQELFATLPVGEQSLVLLMRALVAKAKLVILDEAFAGMNERMVEVTRKYLKDELDDTQAAVFVTHWEQEVPWPLKEVKKITLVDGLATQS
ncbi:hypothetical protein M407DRAFT_151905 [Tulasnella calospora MUT 4182]|uniref:ABC transporter domain-containing protein n=1 Tax=Tulasnella calospora MUT 4182 TaxID=1051891 RepID=A0A0C3QRP0_9AGAM|nr:hypothetical protein M407DRAFT_151905 [Tulasnella calospora MUT 4182]